MVAALSLALRIYNILSLPIFFDEAGYLRWALDIADQRTRMALVIPIVEDGKQPLFMWLAAVASGLFSDPLMAGRVVSGLAGVSSAVALYLAGYWLAGRRVGTIAGLLYAVVPFGLFYDRMALVEAVLNAGGVWAFALSVFVACRARTDRSALLAGAGVGAALGAALWTKMPALFMLPFPVLCAFLLPSRGRRALVVGGFTVAAAVLAISAAILAAMPSAARLLDKANSFAVSPQEMLSLRVGSWAANALEYWAWIQAYFPAPLWMILLAAATWGLVRRTRLALLLLGCWADFTLPTTLVAVPKLYESRYVSQGVFPLLLLIALMMASIYRVVQATAKHLEGRRKARWISAPLVGAILFIAALGPSLWFDLQLLNAPEDAPLPGSDRRLFVTGWTAGYGFTDALRLVKERAAELTKGGQPVIVLGDDPRGTPYAGLKIYMRGMKDVHYYVDMHLARDPEGFMAAWKSHRVPILIVGNDGYDHLDDFERGVPQARRMGFFPKPYGLSSFRVYEVSVADLPP